MHTTHTPRELWKKSDVAAAAKVSSLTVDNWTATRRVPFLKIGHTVRFVPEAVMAALGRFEFKPRTH